MPLPPISKQREIAAILDKVDTLRAARKDVNAHLGMLTRSIFVAMFGEPERNLMRWPSKTLGSSCIIAGEYGANVPSIAATFDRPRYVRITDITSDGTLTPIGVAPAGPRTKWERYELRPGDILFARSGATVGKTYLHKEEDGACVFAGYLVRFRTDERILLPEYLFHFTKTSSYAHWVSMRQRVVAQPNINATEYCQQLDVPIPPLELQREFVKRVKAIDAQRRLCVRSSLAMDELFASLQSSAFTRGF
jgi:type I restriction enzyme, S subunit